MSQIIVKIALLITCLIHSSAQAEVPQLPEDWYVAPEDASTNATAPSFFFTLPWTKQGKMERLVKSILEVNRSSVELASGRRSYVAPVKNTMPNWTPWHLEAFTTELSVVGSGLIGILTGKGTATTLAYWRKKPEPKVATKNQPLVDNEIDSLPTLNAENVYDDKSLKNEIEPMVRAALSTGKIKDEASFRQNAEMAAGEFFNLVSGLQVDPGFKWWVSGVRIEFSVSASGKLTPAVPLATVGGDVRVRFDWKRLARKNASGALKLRNTSAGVFGITGSQSQSDLQRNLQSLVAILAQDLSATFDDGFDSKGFRPYSFRVGLGFSASGNIGVAKSSATAIASVAFSRDVRDPAQPVARLVSDSDPLLLIEQNPSESHLLYATNNLIPFSLEGNRSRAVYSIDRGNFRKGLRKAVKMANFFVAAGSKVGSRKWNLYQIKTGFEFSITGDIGLVKYSGVTTAEMAFYNMNF